MSAFHPIATEQRTQFYVGFVPIGDIARCTERSGNGSFYVAMCGRSELARAFFTFAGLVGESGHWDTN